VDRIKHLLPTPDGGDDPVRISGSCEGLRFGVALPDDAIDDGSDLDDGAEDAAPEAAF